MKFTGSGSESYIGLGEELTWGSGVVPTDFIPFISASFKHDTGMVQSHQSLGRVHRRWFTRVANPGIGRFSTDIWHNGIELLLKYGLGDHYTSSIDTTSYMYSHRFQCARYLPSRVGVADPTYNGLSVTLGAGSLDTTGYQYRYSGFLIDTLSAAFEPTGATVEVSGPFYDSSDLASPPAVVWDNAHLPYATRLSVGLGDPSTTITTPDVTAFNFRINVAHGLATQFPMGLNGGTNYPLPVNPSRGQIMVSGSFDCLARVASSTYGTYTLRQRRDSSYPTTLLVTADGPTITGSSPAARYRHYLLCPTARITSIEPDIPSAEPIKRTVTFEAQYPADTSAPSGYVNEFTWVTRNSSAGFGAFSLV